MSSVVTVQLMRTDMTRYVQDYLAYGLLPAVGLSRAAGRRRDDLSRNEPYALEVLAGALLTLLIVNIRNAWDLTLSMVRQQRARKKK